MECLARCLAPDPAPKDVLTIFRDGILDVIMWFAKMAETHPWASLAFIVLSAILFSPSIRFALRRQVRTLAVSKLKLSEFEVAFDTEARKAVQLSLDQAVGTISAYRAKANTEVQRDVANLGLEYVFIATAKAIFREMFGDSTGAKNDSSLHKQAIDARATLHMADPVFRDRLYQVVNYFPEGGGKGRHFSYRSGVVGRVWRCKLPSSAGYLTHRITPDKALTGEEQVRSIQLEWGLTYDEAMKFKQRPSYCCIPVRKGELVLGLLYIDTTKPDFGWTKDGQPPDKSVDCRQNWLGSLEKCCERWIEEKGLVDALKKLDERVAKTAPRLESEI